MLTHTQIWTGIDRLAQAHGYSASGLAKKAGLDPTSFNKSKRHSPDGKPRWPSTESISKILAVTEATMSDFIALIGEPPAAANGWSGEGRKKEIARETAKILLDTQAVYFNVSEPFTYTSGNTGPVYVDCRKLISFTRERSVLMDFAVEMLAGEIGLNKIDYLAGGETAGIPYAAFIAERMKKPMLYVRKKPKGFGRMSQIEGHMPDEGKNVILIEDVQNYGSSKEVFVDALRTAGAQLDHFFTVFDHGIHAVTAEANAKMKITAHHLCNWRDVVAAARAGTSFDDDTLDSVEKYLNDPQGWTAP